MGERGPKWRFTTPEELATVVDDYFRGVEIGEITQSGLCLHIGIGKTALNEYHKREGYEEIVTMAKLKIENAYEVALREKGGAGNIFALKNFGWVAEERRVYTGDENAPLVTKIIREIVNVTPIVQIEQAPLTGVDEDDDFSANYGLSDGIDDDDDFLS